MDSNYSIILTPIMLLMINEFVRVAPGFIYGAVSGISKDHYPLLVFFAGFIALLTGFVFSAGYLKSSTSTPVNFQQKKISIKSEQEIFLAILAGSLLLILAGLYLFQGVPSVTRALLGLVLGDDGGQISQYISLSRMEVTKGHYFGGAYRGQGIITVLSKIGWPFLSSMALVVFLKTRKYKWLLLFCLLFLLCFIFVAGNGTRGPFMNTIIIYIILYSFTRRISIKFVCVAFLSILLLGILLSSYSNKMHSMLNSGNVIVAATTSILDRILLGNAMNDVAAIGFVRDGSIELRMGAIHMRDIQAALPGASGGLPFSNELAQLLNPGRVVTTFATGTYITKPYVDFGIIGVGLIFLLLGILAGISQKFIFTKIRKDPIHLTMAAMLTYYTGIMVMTSLMSITSSLIILMSFYIFIQIVLKFYRTIIRKPYHYRLSKQVL